MTVVFDPAWAARVAREPWVTKFVRKSFSGARRKRAVLNREVTSAKYEDTINAQETDDGGVDWASEYLSEYHAQQVQEAIDHVERGSDVLRVMLDEAAGDPLRMPASRVPAPGQVTGAGSLPPGNYAGDRRGTVGAAHVRINRALVRIDPAEASRMVRAMAPLRQAIIKDATETFAAVLEEKRLESLPKNSAAFARVKDLVSVCMEAASKIVDRRIAEVVTKGFRDRA